MLQYDPGQETVSFIREKPKKLFFPLCFLRIVALVAKVPWEIFNTFAVSVDLPPSRGNSDSSAVRFQAGFTLSFQVCRKFNELLCVRLYFQMCLSNNDIHVI